MSATLTVSAVSKSFDEHHVLTHVDFSAGPGDLVAVTGERGSGRTTLLRCLTGTYRPVAGTVRLAVGEESIDVASASPRELAWLRSRHIGVYDGPVVASPSEMTREAIGRIAGVESPAAEESLAALGGVTETAIGRLRPAQRRIVALAAALAAPRPLLIADVSDQPVDPGVLGAQIAARRAADTTVVVAVDPSDPLVHQASSIVHLDQGVNS